MAQVAKVNLKGQKASKGELTGAKDTKGSDVRMSNILAAKSVAACIRTSLGPRGMDKMIVEPRGDVVITNDGATILKQLEFLHPCAQMLVEVSKAQDVEAGDGTTSVVVTTGALLRACERLLGRGIHCTAITEGFQAALAKAESVLESMAVPVDINDKETLIKAAVTSLSSKVIASNSAALAPIAVDAVRHVYTASKPSPENDPHMPVNQPLQESHYNVDLKNIRLVKVLGGTVDDTDIVNGMVFKQKASKMAGGPTKIENAKIALIQFCISPPKTDMESQVVVSDYQAMDRLLREERTYLLELCKSIKDTGCNVLLIQKSILRDAVTEQSLHFLAKMKIMVIRDIERDDVDFICQTLGCLPIASAQHMSADKFATAELVQQVGTPDGKIVKVTGVQASKTCTVMLRGSNQLILDEAERSLHDALCVVRCLVKKRYIIAGGGAAEIEIAMELSKWAQSLSGVLSTCVKEYAEAFEVVPYTLSENAGLPPIQMVTALRNQHATGNRNFGINVRKGQVTNMLDEDVVQPLQVTLSAIKLATEAVNMIMKIDDLVMVR